MLMKTLHNFSKTLTTIVLATITLLLSGCTYQDHKNASKPKDRSKEQVIVTNDPKKLDLTKALRYLDTSKTSDNYQKLLSTRPLQLQEQIASLHRDLHLKSTIVTTARHNTFKKWICLERYQGEYVVYDPCDGNTESFILQDSAFIAIKRLSYEIHLYSEPPKFQGDTISADLIAYGKNGVALPTTLRIHPTETNAVYLLQLTSQENEISQYITPQEKVNEFDLLVNHCPIEKTSEFNTRKNKQNQHR